MALLCMLTLFENQICGKKKTELNRRCL